MGDKRQAKDELDVLKAKVRKLEIEQFWARLNVLRCVLDIPICLNLLGYKQIPDGFSGLLGTLTSGISLYTLLNK